MRILRLSVSREIYISAGLRIKEKSRKHPAKYACPSFFNGARGEFVLKRGGNVLKGEWKFRYKKEYTKRERGF